MKGFYCLVISLFFVSIVVKGQTNCGIEISYDDNGYRITRQKLCPVPRTAPPFDSTAVPSAINNQLSVDSLTQIAAGIFKVYPNPTAMSVNVYLDDISLKTKCNLTVMDETGRVFRRQSLNNSVTEIDLTGFANGTFLFSLQRGAQVNSVKVVKLSGMRD